MTKLYSHYSVYNLVADYYCMNYLRKWTVRQLLHLIVSCNVVCKTIIQDVRYALRFVLFIRNDKIKCERSRNLHGLQ